MFLGEFFPAPPKLVAKLPPMSSRSSSQVEQGRSACRSTNSARAQRKKPVDDADHTCSCFVAATMSATEKSNRMNESANVG